MADEKMRTPLHTRPGFSMEAVLCVGEGPGGGWASSGPQTAVCQAACSLGFQVHCTEVLKSCLRRIFSYKSNLVRLHSFLDCC